jgi:purine-nucleoside phosphorylase
MTPTAFDAFCTAVRDAAPQAAVVLGSGLGPVVATLPTAAAIDFHDVPGLAAPTVQGHSGKLLLVQWSGRPVLAFRGRMHYYEGHAWPAVTHTIALAANLGVKTVLLTNAAGGLHPQLNPGELMIVNAHLPLLSSTAWRHHAHGLKDDNPYSPKHVDLLQSIAHRTGSDVLAGTYAGLTGPTYETPAEIRALAAMGADAVGMSTVMEARAAVAHGLDVAAISCITNKAAGLSAAKLDHSEVQDVASRGDVVARMESLVRGFLNAV